jgi:hypothetical protein
VSGGVKSSRQKGLLALDRAVKERCASAPRGKAPSLALGRAPERRDWPHQNQKVRGIAALLAAEAPGRRRKRSPEVQSRAYDVGAPVRARMSPQAMPWTPAPEARGVAFEATRSVAWPWLTQDDDAASATLGFDVEAFEAPPPLAEPYPEPRFPPSSVAVPEDVNPVTAGTPLPEQPAALASDTDEDTAEFTRQIQALLSGVATPPSSSAPREPSPQAAPEPLLPIPAQAASAHDVFSKLGRNMAYATEFRLPAMELGKRFDAIEHEIARDEAQPASRYEDDRSFELTDEEIREGLRLPPVRTSPPVITAPAPNPPVQPAPASPLPDVPLPAAVPYDSLTASPNGTAMFLNGSSAA